MVPPIQVIVRLNAPVKCARPECSHQVADQNNAVFVARHVMVVAYCCSECYLRAWESQLERREEVLDCLGYYEE